MKTIGAINNDAPLINIQTGNVRLAKNMVISKDKTCRQIEGGENLELSLSYGGLTDTKVLGIIDCNSFNIIIGVWDTNKLCIFKQGDIGIMPILITSYITFNPLEIVEGVFQVNNKNETIIAFWNGTQNTSSQPRLLNIDNLPFDVNSNFEIIGDGERLSELTLLQLNRDEARIKTDVLYGEGSVYSGKYSFCLNYVLDQDEATTTIPSRSVFVEDVRREETIERRSHFRGVAWDDEPISGFTLNYRTSTPESIINAALHLYITNLDTRYKKFHLNIIHFNSGTIKVYRIKDIQYNNTTLNYTIFNTKNLEEVSLNSILETNFKLDSIASGKVFKNKLYVGGFKTKSYNYQPFANNIIVKSGIRERSYGGIETFLPDEPYALYSHIVYKDGSIEKGCFISGRLPDTGETNSLESQLFNGELLNSSANYKRFHVNAPVGTNNMGYWENKTHTYDTWLDENLKIFSVDVDGNVIDTNTKINDVNNNLRLHKFPSIYDIALLQSDFGVYPDIAKQYEVFPIFENVLIPNELKSIAQGIIFSYAKKNSTDFHILGYGDVTLGGFLTIYPTPATSTLNVRSFDLLTLKPKLDILCIKDIAMIGSGRVLNPGGFHEYHKFYNIDNTNSDDNIYPVESSIYRPANNAAVIPTNAGQDENINVTMKCELTTTIGCVNIPFWEFKEIWGLDNPNVYPDNSEGVHRIGERCTTHSFGAIISNNLDIHGNCLNAELVNMDIFIKFDNNISYTTNGLYPKGDSYIEDDMCKMVTKYLSNDQIKYNLQYANIEYPVYSRFPIQLRTFINLPYIWDIKYMLEVSRIFNFNQYNIYMEGRILDTNKIPVVATTTDVENLQFDKYLIRSNVLDTLSNVVGWRKFLPLNDENVPNFLIIDLDKGSILQLNINNKAMYIQTTETLYIAGVQDKLTSQVTLEETDVFQLMPNEIVLSDKSRIGCYHKTACILIPQGYIIVDRKNNKIIMIKSGIENIKEQGFENLISKHLKHSGYRSTTNDNISIAYDDEYDRIMIHFNNLYQDNSLVGFIDTPIEIPSDFQLTLPIGGQTINTSQVVPIIKDGEIYFAPVVLSHGTYSIDCSLLINYHSHQVPELLGVPKQISFNYTTGIGWISYSSHISDRLFHTSHKVLGIKGNKIYRFNSYNKFNSFNNGNNYQESFADFIFNVTQEQLISILDTIQVRTDAINESNNTEFNISINKYVVYTDGQCSGELILNNFTNSIFNKTLSRIYNVFHLNKFKDKVSDYTLPFMDEYGAITNIDYNMPFFKQSAFHNKVFVVRLGIIQNVQMQDLDIKNIKLIDINITLQKYIR